MARRNDHTREQLREIILKAAWKIVEKNGVSGLTARHLAKKIGYAPGTIYNIFGSMDELYLHINATTLDKLYSTLANDKFSSTKNTPTQNIKKMATAYRGFAKDHRPHWLMLFTYASPDESATPQWYQDKITLLFDPLEKLLASFFTNKQTRKQKLAARVLWASVHGTCFLEETGKIPLVSNQENAPDMTGYLIDNFVSGLSHNNKSK